MSRIDEALKEILYEHLGCDEEAITDSASFRDDLGADSLDVVEIVMAVEEAFNIEVPDETAETLTTVGKLSEYLHNRLKLTRD